MAQTEKASTHTMDAHLNTTDSVTDATNGVTDKPIKVKHAKKKRTRKNATVAATAAPGDATDNVTNMFTSTDAVTHLETNTFASTDAITDPGTNMFTNATIDTSVVTSVDTSVNDDTTDSIIIDTMTQVTMKGPGDTITSAASTTPTINESSLLTGNPDMSSDTATNTSSPNGSMGSLRRGIWPQLRKDMKRMTHFMRKKVSMSDRRNRIKEISIKQQCWEDGVQPEVTSRRTSRLSAKDADRRSPSAGSSRATSSSGQSTNSTPVVLDDYDEDEVA